MVEHDSIILPGREGKITPEVDVSNMHGGSFKKSVVVNSNAANQPALKLSIGATIKAVIAVSSQFLRFQFEKGKTNSIDIIAGTEKADLKIEDAVFEASAEGAPQWQSNLPTSLNFKVKRAEKPQEDGYYEYTVTLLMKTAPAQPKHGEFVIRTNHPEKAEIRIRGMIETVEKK